MTDQAFTVVNLIMAAAGPHVQVTLVGVPAALAELPDHMLYDCVADARRQYIDKSSPRKPLAAIVATLSITTLVRGVLTEPEATTHRDELVAAARARHVVDAGELLRRPN